MVMTRFQIDDVVMAAPVHLFCGTWGGIAVGLFGTKANIRHSFSIENPRGWGLFHGGGFRQLLVQVSSLSPQGFSLMAKAVNLSSPV